MNAQSRPRIVCSFCIAALLAATAVSAQTNKPAAKQTSRQVTDQTQGKNPVAATTAALTAAECKKLGGFALSDSFDVCPSKMVCKVWDADRVPHQVCLEIAK